MSVPEQVAEKQAEVRKATARKPYHYVGAGLPNVWLVGVEYRVDPASGDQSADIPCLPSLHEALAETLLAKQSSLSGDELRFLRKRLGRSSKDFATLLGVTSEQYSRLENGATLTPANDKLARLLYGALKVRSSEVMIKVAETTWSAEITREERIIATQNADHEWVVQTQAA